LIELAAALLVILLIHLAMRPASNGKPDERAR
jgi:hypothetical protein